MKRVSPVDAVTTDGISASLKRNLAGAPYCVGPFSAQCAAPGAAVVVRHTLGMVPDRISVTPTVHAEWWADDDDFKSWNDKYIVFHASAIGRYTVYVESI